MLRLCLEWLVKGFDLVKTPVTVTVWDDGSNDRGLLRYYKHLPKGVQLRQPFRKRSPRKESQRVLESRLGRMRHAIVEDFLENRDAPFLLMLDDDILVGRGVVKHAMLLYEFLASTSWAKIGALTLHGMLSLRNCLAVKRWRLAELSITGEANLLFHRPELGEIGNHFCTKLGGHADEQFSAIRRAKRKYWCVVCPPFGVQHLGFGPKAGVIEEVRKNDAFWTQRPYLVHNLGEAHSGAGWVSVAGFDMNLYVELVRAGEAAANLAPKHYYEQKGVTP
jgi:hypothetical protein